MLWPLSLALSIVALLRLVPQALWKRNSSCEFRLECASILAQRCRVRDITSGVFVASNSALLAFGRE